MGWGEGSGSKVPQARESEFGPQYQLGKKIKELSMVVWGSRDEHITRPLASQPGLLGEVHANGKTVYKIIK